MYNDEHANMYKIIISTVARMYVLITVMSDSGGDERRGKMGRSR